jgi:Malate synthase
MRLERRPVARRLTVEPIGRHRLDGRGEPLNRCSQVLRHHRGSNRMRAVSVMIEHAANGIELAMPSQKEEENQVIVCSKTGLRDNLCVAVAYTAVWLSGNGAVAIHNLMEDAPPPRSPEPRRQPLRYRTAPA